MIPLGARWAIVIGMKVYLFHAGMESGLGHLNRGVVFALFDRQQQEEEELSLTEGERLMVLEGGCGELKWWKVENGRGQTGEVPSTYLGLYKRVTDVL